MLRIVIALTLALALAACGTKGALYQLPQRQAPSPLFVTAGERVGLITTAADLAVCRPICAAACGPAPSPAAADTAAQVAVCNQKCMETCPAGAASGKALSTSPRNDSKGLSWPALIPAP